jgi:nitrate reductase delta subunit
MATLNHALRQEEIDLDGELPDHLVPVLRYLDRTPTPIAELTNILQPALDSIREALNETDPDNPYLGLLVAAREALPLYQEESYGCK